MTVSRMFNADDDAAAAVDELKAAGFAPSEIQVVGHAAGAVTADDLAARRVMRAHARDYAERIGRGGTLVLVETPLGTAGLANDILAKGRPADTEAAAVRYEASEASDLAAPFSSTLGWPVLARNPVPFSTFWNLPLLATWPSGKTRSFGLKLLSAAAAPLSALLGMKVLSSKAAPLSGLVGMKPLSANPAPLSSLLKLPTLSGKLTTVGTQPLMRNPAPLSSLLGLKVLSGDRSAHP